MTSTKKSGYMMFIIENKEEIINKLKEEKNDIIYGYEILNMLSKGWNNLTIKQRELYKDIAKYINEEPEWLTKAEDILNNTYDMKLYIPYKRLYNL